MRLSALFLFATFAWGQIQNIPNTNFPQVRALLNNNFGYTVDRTECAVIQVSGTVWTAYPKAASTACNFGTGNNPFTVVGPNTVTLSGSSSGTVLFAFDVVTGRAKVHAGALSVTCTGGGPCDVDTATSYGNNEIAIASSTVVSGVITSLQNRTLRAGTQIVQAGAYLLPTYSAGVLRLDVDAAHLPPGPAGPAGPAGAPGYGGTSASTITVGTGSKTFTTQAGFAYDTASRVRVASTGSGAYMDGPVTSYSGTTLIVNVDNISGSGTYSDWAISLIGAVGPQGPTGSTGSTGATGPTALTPGTLASRPATCSPGALYQATDQPAYLQLSMCTSVNNWSNIPGRQTDFITPPFGSAGALAALTGANKIKLYGVYLNTALQVSNITVRVSTPDAVNSYDMGLYSSDGSTLYFNVGPVTLPSGGTQDIPITGAPITLAPGRYIFAFTGTATTGILIGYPGSCNTFLNQSESSTSSSGGALPSSIASPTLAQNMAGACAMFYLH